MLKEWKHRMRNYDNPDEPGYLPEVKRRCECCKQMVEDYFVHTWTHRDFCFRHRRYFNPEESCYICENEYQSGY
jgi:hypothetical protein